MAFWRPRRKPTPADISPEDSSSAKSTQTPEITPSCPLEKPTLSVAETSGDKALGRWDNITTILDFVISRIIPAATAIFSAVIFGANELLDVNTGIATRWAAYAAIVAVTMVVWWSGYRYLADRHHGTGIPYFGAALLVIAFTVGLGERALQTRPLTVSISNPASNQGVNVRRMADSGSGKFTIYGSCFSGSNPSYRVYLLLQPEATSRWYTQRLPADCQQSWSADVYYGSKLDPPKAGDKVRAKAVLVRPEDIGNKQEIDQLTDIKPVAQSDTITIPILSIDQEK